jgi:tryptophanase
MVPEPYRTRVVEPIRLPSREERRKAIENAHYNPHLLPSEKVYVDLISDSGTGALSARQLAAMVEEDESFAFQRSYSEFVGAVESIFGFPHVYPVHQGRAGEHILCNILVERGATIPSNTHFGTTRANVRYFGGDPVDFVVEAAYEPQIEHPFKGNIDLKKVENLIQSGKAVPVAFLTITNNSLGSQPCSLENVREYKELLGDIPLYLDACRFAENAWFIKQREKACESRHVREIVEDIFSVADGCIVSGKKDGLSHIGGFVATRDKKVAHQIENLVLLMEGFHTHGGVAGRDLKILSLGLEEVLDEDYLASRHSQVSYLFHRLAEREIPLYRPPGGNAVYVDAEAFLPHLQRGEFPNFALACEIYLNGGVRVATSGLPDERTPQLVRLSLPRRVYSISHLDYVVDVVEETYSRREAIGGLVMSKKPPHLVHHAARFTRS